MWKLVLGHASMTSNQPTKALLDWTTVSHDILYAFLNKKKSSKVLRHPVLWCMYMCTKTTDTHRHNYLQFTETYNPE